MQFQNLCHALLQHRLQVRQNLFVSLKSNPQTKPRILWKFQDNVNTTIPEYAERLFVSNVRRNEREKYPIERYTFKLFKVNTNDEGYYDLNVGFSNEEMDLDSRVSLDVHGKDIN